VVFTAPGYDPETQVIEASKNQVLAVALKQKDADRPEPRARPPRPPTKRRPKTKIGSDAILDL
jgi:hypothetical protein